MKNQVGVLERQRFVEKFSEGTVIHWKEAIWTDRPQNGRNQLVGEQEVTGQIVSISDQYVSIRIITAKITDERLPESGKSSLIAHEAGKTIRKKISTLLKGGVEKLPDQGGQGA